MAESARDTVMVDAACAMLVRGGADALEVLLVQRGFGASFAPGSWVFAGGVLEPRDDGADLLERLRVAAARECLEEVGVLPGAATVPANARSAVLSGQPLAAAADDYTPDALVFCDHWITPPPRPKRFSTRFFICEQPPGTDPVPDGVEMIDAKWWRPADAVAAFERKDIRLFFPQRVQLARFAKYDSAEALMAWARALEHVEVIAPGAPTP